MTITPLSLSSSAAASGAGASIASDAEGAAGFADLLSVQLSDLGALLQLGAKAPEKSDAAPAEKTEEVISSDDPAQLLAGLMAAMPPATPRADTATGKPAAKPDALLASGKSAEKLSDAPLPGANLPPEAVLKDVLQKAPAIAVEAAPTAISRDDTPAAKIAAAPAAEVPAGGFAQALANHISEPRHMGGRGEPAPIVSTPLGDNRWPQDFGEKLVWMANSDRQSAQININPPQLGPVQITLDIKGGEATAYFASPHGEVRQAIESALPHLREMLAGAGIDLGQTNVGAQFARQDAQNQSQQSDSSRFSDDNAILHGDSNRGATTPVAVQRGRGMVDLFA